MKEAISKAIDEALARAREEGAEEVTVKVSIEFKFRIVPVEEALDGTNDSNSVPGDVGEEAKQVPSEENGSGRA